MIRNRTSTAARRESGSVTAFFVVIAVAVVATGSLVFDAGRIMTARRLSARLASSAARIAATWPDEKTLDEGGLTLDLNGPDQAAEMLADNGLAPCAKVANPDAECEILVDGDKVTVKVRRKVKLSALLGGADRRVSASATAQFQAGVTGKGI